LEGLLSDLMACKVILFIEVVFRAIIFARKRFIDRGKGVGGDVLY